MHQFSELVDKVTKFSIAKLKSVDEESFEALEGSGATVHVKALQMTQLHRAILAVGMLSLFEANLQDALGGNGFDAAKKILVELDEVNAKDRFEEMCLAVNALKHGRGRSYEALVSKAGSLPFKIKMPGEDFFEEGDVAEIRMLVEVNDDFLQRCADVIIEASEIVRRVGASV